MIPAEKKDAPLKSIPTTARKKKLQKQIRIFGLFMIMAIVLVSVIIYWSMLGNYHELEEQRISITNEQFVNEIEISINFGKSLDNYYGLDQKMANVLANYPQGFALVVYNQRQQILYATLPQEEIIALTRDRAYRMISQPILEDGGQQVGELATIYPAGIVSRELQGLRERIIRVAAMSSALGLIVMGIVYLLLNRRKESEAEGLGNDPKKFPRDDLPQGPLQDTREGQIDNQLPIDAQHQDSRSDQTGRQELREGRRVSLPQRLLLGIMAAVLIGHGLALIYYSQKAYRVTIMESSAGIVEYLKSGIERLENKGVRLDDMAGLSAYLAGKTEYPIVGRISISILVADSKQSEPAGFSQAENGGFSVVSTYLTKNSGQTLEISIQGSESYINRRLLILLLLLLATLITGLVILVEILRLPELLEFRFGRGLSTGFNTGSREQIRQIAANLRLSSFLGTMANYICFPFAAMLIRDWGQAIPGLSVGMTAALSITVCAVTEAVGMLALAGRLPKLPAQKLLIVSNGLLLAANLLCFAAGSALLVILLRALAGLALAGNKTVTNYIIAAGYGVRRERERNLAESNAGLIGGILCGTSLGAIIATVAGYEATFIAGAVLTALYFIPTYILTPWKYLQSVQSAAASDAVPLARVWKMLKHPQLLQYFIGVSLAINFSIMLIVTLIPAVIQQASLPAVALTYCYLFNGLAGLYLAPKLVGKVTAKFGLKPTMLAVAAATGLAVFILKLPPLPAMLLASSLLLGLVDGIGTPLASDYFLEMKHVRRHLDDATALSVLSLYSFINLALAPVLADLMLARGQGMFFVIPLVILGLVALTVRRMELVEEKPHA